MELSDREHVENCLRGSADDFRLLVSRYQRPLFAYLSGRLGDQLQAEEAAQESFVRAFLSLDKLHKPESFYAWLLGIAGRVLKEQFRLRQRSQRDSKAAEELLTAAAPESQTDYPLEEAISSLPEQYRQVILLHYYEGLSCQEAGQRLGMPVGTVTKTLSRAYALLRHNLEARERMETTLS